MEDFVLRANDRELRILVDKALSTLFKGFNGLVIPPVSVVSTLVVVSTGRVKSYTTLVC